MNEEQKKEARAKQLVKVVCICKGIRLGSIIKVLDQCNTVEDVNKLTGCGSGGCNGERCRPRIKKILEKKEALKKG